MRSRIEVRAERATLWNTIDLYLLMLSEHGEKSIASPMAFERLPSGEYRPPALRLELDEAQSLMDELWRAGLRPTEGSGSAGSLAATERHLQDMRGIAMGLLKGEF